MGVCPYARAFIGQALSSPDVDAVVLTTTCDQMRRAAEWVTLAGGPPVFLMNVPATWQTPASVRMYRDELERLGRFLVQRGGQAPLLHRLVEVMEDYDVRRARLRGLVGTLTPRRASEAMRRFDLGEEIAPDEHVAGVVPRGTPVALVGGPLMNSGARVFDLIEQAGGLVVLDGTENGARTLPAPFDRRRLHDDPMLELVDAYFGTIPDAFRRPDTRLQQWLDRELAASGARGIIVWRYVWCDLWAAEVMRLREATGLPVLDVDISADEAGLARTANRIQAFLEVLG
jgi:benzoyl-CoA reductase/2-hydroxyglutaryl-CoA dehydratase subunit BcrC/BadD/HgdB